MPYKPTGRPSGRPSTTTEMLRVRVTKEHADTLRENLTNDETIQDTLRRMIEREIKRKK